MSVHTSSLTSRGSVVSVVFLAVFFWLIFMVYVVFFVSGLWAGSLMLCSSSVVFWASLSVQVSLSAGVVDINSTLCFVDDELKYLLDSSIILDLFRNFMFIIQLHG